jgi:phosphatidylglycerol:prolipoprotein diacylglycerol transferase
MIRYPEISPELLSLGPIKVRWYGLMYVIGYLVGARLLKYRAEKKLFPIPLKEVESYVTYLIIGMLLGARTIYKLVYDLPAFLEDPIGFVRIWEGGLSFHGALIGMIIASWMFGKKHGLSFYVVTDALAFAGTPGLFFGRMGNFINGELLGRPTDLPWAMLFPGDPSQLPRHPSQLYQGFTEGILLWLMICFAERWALARKKSWPGLAGTVFLVGYGCLRFLTEFAREPDSQLGYYFGFLSMGQILCVLTALGGLFVFWDSRRKFQKSSSN